MNVIETRCLTRRFGGNEAVRDLDLVVPKGRICALLGPNGAGKTTTLKVLMGLLRPSAGRGWILGEDVTRIRPATKGRIGYVSENQEIPDWMTVRVFLDYCAALHPAWDKALEAALLERFELPPGRPLRKLSRGMRMKALLLSSLAYRPELLVLDEPFSGLDPAVREDLVRGVFDAIGEGEWSVIVSSHDIHEVERFVDWVAILQEGRLVLTEALDDLQGRHRRIEVTLVNDSSIAEESWPPAWRKVERAGRLLRFTDTAYEEEASGRRYRELFPGAVVVSSALSLRDIYLVTTAVRREVRQEVKS